MALLLLLASATVALAHLALSSATPSDGDRLERAPIEIVLDFTEPVELPFFSLRLSGPAGIVSTGAVEDLGGRQRLRVPIAGALIAGRYSATWQAVGRDGHPVRGELSFEIASGAEGLAPAAPGGPVGAAFETSPPPTTPTFSSQSPLFALVRWLGYLGIIGSVGALGFALLLRSEGRRESALPATFRSAAGRGAAGLGALAILLLIVSLPLRLQAQSHALFGAGITSERFSLLLSSGWGTGWVLQAVGSVVVLIGLVLARAGSPAGWGLAAVGALGIVASPGFQGHAASAEPLAPLAMLTQSAHILGVSLWFGTLFVLVAVGVPLARRAPQPDRGPMIGALLAAFSPLALVSAAVVVMTGVFAASLFLEHPSDLFTSAYGRLLSAKLFLVAIALAAGAYNAKVASPRVASTGVAQPLTRMASAELTATVLIVGLTAVLVAIPPPSHGAGQTTAAAAATPSR